MDFGWERWNSWAQVFPLFDLCRDHVTELRRPAGLRDTWKDGTSDMCL